MTDQIAQRMSEIPLSGIRAVMEKVDAMRREGRTVIPFYIGRPDFDTPVHIKEAAKQALDQGQTAYTSNYGTLELRKAIAATLARENGLKVDPASQVLVTVGANEAIAVAMLATLNPGDEVLLPDPMWPNYIYCARLAGARAVSVPLSETNSFELDPSDLERLVTKRTRMVLINSPHNPTGAVYSPQVIEGIADVVYRHGLTLLSDEIYDRIVFDGARPVSPGTLERIADQTITVNGFSKAYSMTGWRLGYAAASPALINAMLRVHQNVATCAVAFAQAGGVVALNGPQDSVVAMVAEFDRRRRAIVAAFQDMPGVSLVTPRGAFYAFPNCKSLGLTSAEVADQLLTQAGIAVVPGTAFGQYGEGYLRLAYSCSFDDVQRGMAALRNYLTQRR